MNKIRNLFIRVGLIDFKVGDRVKPNPKIFYKTFKFIPGEEYAYIRKVEKDFIRIYGRTIPYSRRVMILA